MNKEKEQTRDMTKIIESHTKTFESFESMVAKRIFVKLIEVSKNFNGSVPLGVLKAWAIEYGVDINDIK